jgi:deazaflavin-dependent oxidoreductase (nitroreductase family)
MTRAFVGWHTALYRLTGGWVGGWVGAPILLLTTRGRKSGRRRTLPLLFLKTDRGYAIVASYGGSDRHPAWYLNLVAEPEVEIQVGPFRRKAIAETVDAERRAELWPKLLSLYRGYDDYQARTEREIPVVEITPVAG